MKLEDLLALCFENDHVIKRKVKITGKALSGTQKVALWLGKQRVNVSQKADSWSAQIAGYPESNIPPIRADGVKREISVHISGLFSLSFKLDSKGHPIPINKEIGARDGWLDMLFEDKTTMDLNFLTSGFSHTWEARYAVVQKYVETVNQITGRNTEITLNDVQKHWHRQLVLPFEICGDLTNEEYALLIEKLPPESPIQIQARAVRHYPQNYLASHVLGYVGSGYEANPETMTGSDLATFELQGRTGKAGIEKTYDNHLRGKDGVDIWIVNPMGSRFERLERQPSQKENPFVSPLILTFKKLQKIRLTVWYKKLQSKEYYLIRTGQKLLKEERGVPCWEQMKRR